MQAIPTSLVHGNTPSIIIPFAFSPQAPITCHILHPHTWKPALTLLRCITPEVAKRTSVTEGDMTGKTYDVSKYNIT